MTELAVTAATIVTKNEAERIAVDGRTIDVVPAWRYLLGLPKMAE